MSKDKIIVKSGTIELSLNRDDLVSCYEAPDGVVFQLKNGLVFQYTNNFMENITKARIKLALDKIPNGTIRVDLNNHKNPVTIDNT